MPFHPLASIDEHDPLYFLIKENDVENLQIYLDNHPELNMTEEEFPEYTTHAKSALHHAVYFNQLEIVLILREFMGEKFFKDNLKLKFGENGNTPLHFAVYRRNLPITKIFLDSGDSEMLFIVNNLDYSPIQLAAKNQNSSFMELIAQYLKISDSTKLCEHLFYGETVLQLAAQFAPEATLRLLLNAGAMPSISRVKLGAVSRDILNEANFYVANDSARQAEISRVTYKYRNKHRTALELAKEQDSWFFKSNKTKMLLAAESIDAGIKLMQTREIDNARQAFARAHDYHPEIFSDFIQRLATNSCEYALEQELILAILNFEIIPNETSIEESLEIKKLLATKLLYGTTSDGSDRNQSKAGRLYFEIWQQCFLTPKFIEEAKFAIACLKKCAKEESKTHASDYPLISSNYYYILSSQSYYKDPIKLLELVKLNPQEFSQLYRANPFVKLSLLSDEWITLDDIRLNLQLHHEVLTHLNACIDDTAYLKLIRAELQRIDADIAKYTPAESTATSREVSTERLVEMQDLSDEIFQL